MHEQSIDPKIRLYVKTETEESRAKTLRIFGVLAAIFALLTGSGVYGGVYGLVKKHTDDLIKKGALSDIKSEAKQSLERTKASSASAAQYAEKAKDIAHQSSQLKNKYEEELKRLRELNSKIESVERSLANLQKQSVKYDSSIHLESSNVRGEFARHYKSMLRIGGERNIPYEGDRTWIIRKK